MKKAICIAAVLLLAVMFAALSGCSNDEGKAREYIDAAREKSKSAAQKQLEIQRRGEELTEFLEEVGGITPEAVAAAEELLDKLIELAEVTAESAGQAKAEYEKVLDLEGVEKYKEYARNRIRALELAERRSELATEFAGIYSEALKAALQTGQIDEATLRSFIEPLIVEREEISAEIDELNEEAAELEEELDL